MPGLLSSGRSRLAGSSWEEPGRQTIKLSAEQTFVKGGGMDGWPDRRISNLLL